MLLEPPFICYTTASLFLMIGSENFSSLSGKWDADFQSQSTSGEI